MLDGYLFFSLQGVSIREPEPQNDCRADLQVEVVPMFFFGSQGEPKVDKRGTRVQAM